LKNYFSINNLFSIQQMEYKKTIKELYLYKMKIPFNLEPLTADTNTCEDTYSKSHHNPLQDHFENNEKYQSLNPTNDSTLDVEKLYFMDKNILINNKEDKQGKICSDENLKNDENIKNDKKKGKSNSLPKQAEDIFLKVKTHYENKNDKIPHLFRMDGIRKKIKTHFFKWIKKNLDQKIFQLTKNKKLKFKKLEQNTIANINLKFNSDLLQKSVFQVYDKDCEENRKLMQMLSEKIILKKETEKENEKILKFEEFKESLEFLNTPLYLLYTKYFYGNQYKKDFKKIQKKINYLIEEEETKEDKRFILLYLKIYEIFSENFVDYYMKTLPNKRSFPTNQRPIKNSTEYENENETNSNSNSVSESDSDSEDN
jgi:hypothetical protein